MIVLDEHLKKSSTVEAIRRWYRGSVCYVTDLRPGSIVKDEAIITLLRATHGPTFVTLDWNDEWLRQLSRADEFCIVSIAVPSSKADQIPELIRRVMSTPALNTRAKREGRIVRLSGDEQIEVLDATGITFTGLL